MQDADVVETAIQQTERLYQALTGQTPPQAAEKPYSEIPPEKNPVRFVEEQLDRLISLLPIPGPSAAQPAWRPPLTVWDSEHELLVCLEVAGVERSSIDVQVQGNRVEIRGQRTPPPVNGGGAWRIVTSERPMGEFTRTLVLPPQVQADRVSVHLKDGLLEIRIPRVASELARQIPIE